MLDRDVSRDRCPMRPTLGDCLGLVRFYGGRVVGSQMLGWDYRFVAWNAIGQHFACAGQYRGQGRTAVG